MSGGCSRGFVERLMGAGALVRMSVCMECLVPGECVHGLCGTG